MIMSLQLAAISPQRQFHFLFSVVFPSPRGRLFLMPLRMRTLLLALVAFSLRAAAEDSVSAVRREADSWRAEHRIIDLHQHIDCSTQHLARAVKIMDTAGVGLGVNLSGGYVTHKDGEISEFERNKALADQL